MSDISPEERARKIGGCVLNDEIRAYVIDLAQEEIRAAEQAAREDERSKIQHDCEQAILDFDRDSLAAFVEWQYSLTPDEIADAGLERMREECAKQPQPGVHWTRVRDMIRALPLHEETSDG